MKIEYLVGDATRPQSEGPTVIAHISNNRGGWGAGFTGALSKRSKWPEKAYREWFHQVGALPLGEIQLVSVEFDLWVANLIAQNGYKGPKNPHPCDLIALSECLEKLAAEALRLNTRIAAPRLGCGLGGAKWADVEKLLIKHLVVKGIPIEIYDLP